MNRRFASMLALAALALGGLTGVVKAPHRYSGPFPDEPKTPATTGERAGKVVLFGDLHAHTTISIDAALMNGPAVGGQGFAMPMQACQFARHCANLDFWSINDHAELTFEDDWSQIKEAIRACNFSYGGYTESPEMVSYLGWEWTQARLEDDANYGHKNVIFLETEEDKVPKRPIGWARMQSLTGKFDPRQLINLLIPLTDLGNFRYGTYAQRKMIRNQFRDTCPSGVASPDLPLDCQEVAPTPKDLYAKLDEWGLDTIVIPHSGAWGFHNPPLMDYRMQLTRAQHDPERELLIELYSGHGNSEQWKPWLPYTKTEGGDYVCPEPTEDYEPCCWRAKQMAKTRDDACVGEGDSPACRKAMEHASQTVMKGSYNYRNAFDELYPDEKSTDEEWLDCGQCRNCFNPAFQFRPRGSIQYASAIANEKEPEEDGDPLRYRFGFIGSTDEHRGRPGSGYKDAKKFSDTFGPMNAIIELGMVAADKTFGDWRRQSSFWFSGGAVGVHSEGRSREQIWAALKRKEVFATSGKRMLVWFDLLAEDGSPAASMGSTVAYTGAPTFNVRAVGDFKQKPGCPETTVERVGQEFIDEVCLNECYNPTPERFPIERIEVIRIKPQLRADEPIAGLIEDPWKTIPCEPSQEGCEATFSDPEYPSLERPALYYVRALQPETPVYNAGGLRCQGLNGAECTEVRPCYGGRKGEGDDCLTPAQDRVWSSPIYLER